MIDDQKNDATAVALLDLRGVPIWDRPSKVTEVFDKLPPGEAITFVTENEPRGLANSIEATRKHELVLDPRRVGEAEWHVTLTRTTSDVDFATPIGILKKSPAFSYLDGDAHAQLAAAATLHVVRRGQAIVTENTDWPYIGVAFDGAFALSSGVGSSRQRIYYEIFPYETFGEAEFFDGALAVGRVIALSKVGRYLRLPREAVAEIGTTHPHVLRALGRMTAQRLRNLTQTLAAHGTTPIIARIASVLLPYASPERGLTPALAPLPSMTQAQIAAVAGTVKEVAARAIAELESRALLKREHGHIYFLDREKLVALVREAR